MGDRVPLHEYDSPTHHNGRDPRDPSPDRYDSARRRDPSPPQYIDPDPDPDPDSRRSASATKRRLERRKSRSNFVDNRRIDLVLVYKDRSLDEVVDPDDRKTLEMRLDFRQRFMVAMKVENLEVQKEKIGEYIYLKIHTPFDRLCKEAESIQLQMPLKGCEIYEDKKPGCWKSFEENHLETDNEIDFVSAPFALDKKHIFEGIENQQMFFRPAHRSFLTHHILINIDVRKMDQEQKDDDPLSRKGLPWMLHKGIFSDWFLLHDETVDDPAEKEELEMKLASQGQDNSQEINAQKKGITGMLEQKELLMPDTRRELHNTWGLFRIKYQPLWKIRNYFGEKIALYFAWVGTLITTLWIPTLFGIAVFIYGLYLSIVRGNALNSNTNSTSNANATQDTPEEIIKKVKEVVENSLAVIKEAFDNEVTPYFALVICLWGTVFLEIWKRTNATLAYEWDVDSFEDTEPDRPQFYGTQRKPDPVTLEPRWYYPLKRQFMKYATSGVVLLVMVLCVFISVAAVILYRVIMTVDYCTKVSSTACLLISTVAASVLNATSILILGRVYDKLAVVLTNWENHRTQTQYDDSLILKLFAFQFANSYTSLFYIAFFRNGDWPNGVFNMGPEYQDACTDSGGCMAMLSFQVLVLMLMKPLPKLLKDIVLAWLIKKWKKRTWCRRSAKTDPNVDGKVTMNSFLQREQLKSDLGDFTLSEYTEKVIIYGFLMLFAASFPLAPLIALLVAVFDIRVDARRMIWMYRRPLCQIAQDIGMWYNILQFLNFAGVISNAFLIAFTSAWGQKYNLQEKLLVVLIFEHVVFAVKFFIEGVIPDIPGPIKLARKREKYQVGRILERATQEMYSDDGKRFNDPRDPDGRVSSAVSYANETDADGKPKKRRSKKKKRKNSDGESHYDDLPKPKYRLSPLNERPPVVRVEDDDDDDPYYRHGGRYHGNTHAPDV